VKTIVLTCLSLTLAAAGLFGQAAADDPLEFLPPALRPAAAPEWLAAYTDEFARLGQGAVITPEAFRRAREFCRAARFPDDPLRAARLVRGAIAEFDLRLRSGEPAAFIKVAVASDWKAELANENAPVVKKNDSATEKKLKRDLSIAGDQEQSLPLNRGQAKKLISDKIKVKKEKEVK
jgi:hypothetical protein